MNNFIYLLQEREFINAKKEIYKVGKTTQDLGKRITQYPKQSKVLIHIACDNCSVCEKEILKIFNNKYKLRKDIGNESFEGDSKSMMKDIVEIVLNDCEKEAKVSTDFIEKNIDNLKSEDWKVLIQNPLVSHIIEDNLDRLTVGLWGHIIRQPHLTHIVENNLDKLDECDYWENITQQPHLIHIIENNLSKLDKYDCWYCLESNTAALHIMETNLDKLDKDAIDELKRNINRKLKESLNKL